MPPITLQRLTLPVSGMTCASCVARVEKTIRKVNGTSDIAVNLATEKVSFSFDPTVTDAAAIATAVESAGYTLTLPQTEVLGGQLPGWEEAVLLRRNLITAAALSVPISILNMGVMLPGFSDALPWSTAVNNIILFFLTAPVLLFPGRRFFILFIKNLKHFTADMNSLVAIGTGSAFLYSTAAAFFPAAFPVHHEVPEVYFDTAAVIITLILLGKWLEGRAKQKTKAELKKLLELQPKTAVVIRGGIETTVPITSLAVGDMVVVKPGERIAADGVVIEGITSVDESPVTGESMPVEKQPGGAVFSGSINLDGAVVFSVTAAGDNSVLGQIARLVETAQGSKAPIQSLADKIASVFVPTVVAAALITFAAWLISGATVTAALMSFVAVLIIACPCALGLATPTALIVGIGNAARHGLLIKNGEALERLQLVTHAAFDKTGTLTEGKPSVAGVYPVRMAADALLQLAAAAEARSEHPLGKAVYEEAVRLGYTISPAAEFTYSQGNGVTGNVEGNLVMAGKALFLFENGVTVPTNSGADSAAKGYSLVFTAVNGEYAGYIALHDAVKPSATGLADALRHKGIEPVLISGDNAGAVAETARLAGITTYYSGVLPSAKAEIIKKLQLGGAVVAMSGDGINDAPALAQSDVSIAMSKGTDIAIETADLTILSHRIGSLADAVELSRRTIAIIKQNLFWAFIYNVIGIPLAAFGKLDPMLAALAMSLSSVSVISNSLRLKKFRFRN